MAKKRNRAMCVGRKESHYFVRLIDPLVSSKAWGDLSPWAVKLYIEIAKQYKGDNNGDLSATFSQLQHRGWRSKSTLSSAIKELIEKGFIIRTRIGWNNQCNLYALTCWGIDECNDKLDVKPNPRPLRSWMKAA